jgi:hypothetical protein
MQSPRKLSRASQRSVRPRPAAALRDRRTARNHLQRSCGPREVAARWEPAARLSLSALAKVAAGTLSARPRDAAITSPASGRVSPRTTARTSSPGSAAARVRAAAVSASPRDGGRPTSAKPAPQARLNEVSPLRRSGTGSPGPADAVASPPARSAPSADSGDTRAWVGLDCRPRSRSSVLARRRSAPGGVLRGIAERCRKPHESPGPRVHDGVPQVGHHDRHVRRCRVAQREDLDRPIVVSQVVRRALQEQRPPKVASRFACYAAVLEVFRRVWFFPAIRVPFGDLYRAGRHYLKAVEEARDFFP